MKDFDCKNSVDYSIKEFVVECDELLASVDNLLSLLNSPFKERELASLKKEVLDVRNLLIVEAYNREFLDWK